MTLIVIADDLTGGADCQAAIWPRAEARVWLPSDGQPWLSVLGPDAAAEPAQILDIETRLMSPAEGGARLKSTLGPLAQGVGGVRPRVYLKVDSTLRGHVGDAAAAAAALLDVRVVPVVVASPMAGRTTHGGLQYVDGVEIARTPFARDPTHPITDSRVAALFGDEWIVEVVSTEELRERPERVAHRLTDDHDGPLHAVLLDATTDDHMTRIAQVVDEVAPRLIVGSAGLLGHLHWSGPAPTPQREVVPGPILAVVGSAHPNARRQAETLADALDVELVVVSPGAEARAARRAAASLSSRRCAILCPEPFDRTPGANTDGAAIAAAMGEVARRCDAMEPLAGLVVVGGHTAYSVIHALGVRSFVTRGSVAAGMPICATDDVPPRTLVLKPGGFGHERVLVDAMAALGVPR